MVKLHDDNQQLNRKQLAEKLLPTSRGSSINRNAPISSKTLSVLIRAALWRTYLHAGIGFFQDL